MFCRIALSLCLLMSSTASAAEVDEQTRVEWRTAIGALVSPDPVIRASGIELLGALSDELPDRNLGNSYTLIFADAFCAA